jgi:hypothetical protein
MPKDPVEKVLESERRALVKDLSKEMSADTRKLYLEILRLEEETRAFHKDVSDFIAETKKWMADFKSGKIAEEDDLK